MRIKGDFLGNTEFKQTNFQWKIYIKYKDYEIGSREKKRIYTERFIVSF